MSDTLRAAWTDTDILEELRLVDGGDFDVTPWESRFLESVLYSRRGPLSKAQRRVALQIVEKYSNV